MDRQKQFQRLLTLISRLHGSAGLTVRELGGHNESTRRQIQRDLLSLRECGMPLQSTEGEEAVPRYRLENLRLAGAQLDLEETLAVTLATLLAGESDFGNLARQGWNKLHYAVVNGQERQAKTDLPKFMSAQTSWELPTDLIKTISTALLQSRRLRLLYRGFKDESARWRLVEPQQFFFQDRWYLAAFEPESKISKNFRAERIQELECTGEAFQRHDSHNPHFHKWDLAGDEPVTVRCRVDAPVARWLQENQVHHSQQLEGQFFSLTVRDTESFLLWSLGLSHCEILEPAPLRQRSRARLEEMLARFEVHD